MRRPLPRIFPFAFAAATLAAASIVCAQTAYPTKPVRVIVTFAPGGVTDIATRIIAPKLGEALGQPVIVENRAGAGGVIGADAVAKAAPDGYTLLSAFDNFASSPYLYKSTPYDPIKDFVPISLLVRSRPVIVVNPTLGVSNFQDFVRVAKAKGNALNYASAGGGTSSHLIAELLKMTVGIEPAAVHYKGGAPAIKDVLGGQVEMMVATISIALPHVRSGKLTALAVTSASRTALLPGVPAVSEFYPGFDAQSWIGFLAPAGTPREIIARLNAELDKTVTSPEVRPKLEAQGFEIVGTTPEAFGDWIRTESAKWSRVIRERHITVE